MIRINQRIEIIVEDEETANLYHSRIEEVADDHLLLAMPSYRGLPILLIPGMEILVRFIQDGAVYQFKSVYRDKQRDPIPVWVVSPAFEITKIQRRSFYRLETYLPVTLQLEKEPVAEAAQAVILNLQTKDISGGGVRVISKTLFEPGTEVLLELTLPGKLTVHTKGKVVRSEPSAPESSIHWISIEFIDIDEHDRKKIISFVFHKQLEQR